MASALPLRAALTRGVLLTAANWPIILIEFTLESLYKLALAVPIVGGAFMVAVLLGEDVRVLFEGELRSAVELVVQSLHNAPVALASFFVAVGLVAVGGAVVVFAVKAGTLGTLVVADAKAGEFHRSPLTLAAFRRAGAFDARQVLAAIHHFWTRSAKLAVWLSLAYLVIGVVYVGAFAFALRVAESAEWAPFWPLIILISTSTGLVAVAVVNLISDLLRVIMVTDDCDLRGAAQRLRRFVIQDARQVLGIFGVIGAFLLLATAASVMTTAGLTLVAWVPVAGLISLPLRAAAWLIQGLLFQFLALTALSAYQTQYRRFATPATPVSTTDRFREHA
jgi:hypothetical protein